MSNAPADRLIRSILEKAWGCLAPATALMLAWATPAAAALPSQRVHLVAGMDASSRWDQSPRVGFAIEIHNSGPGRAANVQVRDIRYDATDEVLVIGRYGRGAFSLAQDGGHH